MPAPVSTPIDESREPVKTSRLPSRKRRVVIEMVERLDRPFTMEELFAAVRRRSPEIGRSTVYRAVLWLEAEARIVAVVTPSGRSAFLASPSRVACITECPQCGALRQIDGAELADSARQVAAGAGLTFLKALWTFAAPCAQHAKRKNMNMLAWWTFLVHAPEMGLPLC